MGQGISIIIPALNEECCIEKTVQAIKSALSDIDHEIIVVDDGSTDRTGELAVTSGARVIRHPANGGYGLSIKSGIQEARYDIIGIVDADGTYPIDQFPKLYQAVARQGFHMAVIARTGRHYNGSPAKSFFRRMLKIIVELSCGQRIPDVNSGMRVFRKSDAKPYLPTLSNTFSFTTSITLAYLINCLFVQYLPAPYCERVGVSKVHHLHDSLRALQAIVHAIIFYNPIKLFLIVIIAFICGSLSSLLIGLVHPGVGIWFFFVQALSLLFLSMGFLGVAISHVAASVKQARTVLFSETREE